MTNQQKQIIESFGLGVVIGIISLVLFALIIDETPNNGQATDGSFSSISQAGGSPSAIPVHEPPASFEDANTVLESEVYR